MAKPPPSSETVVKTVVNNEPAANNPAQLPPSSGVYHPGNVHYLPCLAIASLLLLVCVSFTIIGQPRNSILIRKV